MYEQALPAGEKVCIVEIGSGSGGTSLPVMEALAAGDESARLGWLEHLL